MPPILLSPQAKLSEIGNVSVANADGARCERRRHPVRPKAKSTWGNRRSELPKPITSLGGWLLPDRMEIRAHDWTPGPKHRMENSHGRIYRSRRVDERDVSLDPPQVNGSGAASAHLNPKS
jgi:hypothetical protein